uniref:Uncharacterized protein n=1 Tax=Brassica oleracea var. oleracea TaxID=109376 RepID=A0A0D3DLH7_BRAOL
MMKALKDIRKSHKQSTSTRAPVPEPSLFISEKPKGKSETHVEEYKDFSDSLPIFDEYDEEQIESLFSCEKTCDIPSLKSEFMDDNEQTIVELTVLQPEHQSSLVFEEEPLDLPHQGPRLDTRISFDEDLDPISDEEDEPGLVFDEEATNITSIAMESHLCFDPGTTPARLSSKLQEHLFVLIIQERQVQPLRNESIDCAQQPEIWRSFVVQTGYLGDASDRVSVQNGYLTIPKPTHQGLTEAWNHLKSFTEEGVMNFKNWRFSSPSIREYQTSKGDSGPRKKRPEPKPIIHEPMVFPQLTSCSNQKHCKDHGDKHDHFPRRASNDGRQRTWNYLMKTTSKLQGILCPIFSFTEFPLNFKSCVSDFFSFDIGTMDLRTNPFEEGEYDVPQSTDQSEESDQHDVQDDLNILSKTVPHASKIELWLEPWPDDRFYRTGLCLPRPVFHFKKNSRDRITFGRTNPDSVHRFSFLVTARTARTSGLELQQYPRPDDRIFRTGACLSRTILHFKINGQDSLDCIGRVLTLSAGHAEDSLNLDSGI